MSGGSVDVCGNCGAPLEMDEEGKCRWCHASVRIRQHRVSRPAFRWNRRLTAIAAAALAIAAGLGVGVSRFVGSHQSGPPAATARAAPAQPAVAPGETGLQALRQDFGPWRQLTGTGGTGGPALLLLDHGGSYASARWTVPASAPWTQDIGGNVASVQVSGATAAITDADGIRYAVAVNQPFILSSNPGTALLIGQHGAVLSMSLAQATALRQPLRK